MKKFIIGLLLLSTTAGALSSCKDADKDPAPPVTSVPLILPQLSSDPEKQTLNRLRASTSINNLPNLANPTRPVFEFTIDIPNQRDVKIKRVEVYKSFRRGTAGLIGPRTLAAEYSSFPATVSLSSQEILTDLRLLTRDTNTGARLLQPLLASSPAAQNPVFVGDFIIFTFEYVLEDNTRVILTPLTPVQLANGTTIQVISGTQINFPYSITAPIVF